MAAIYSEEIAQVISGFTRGEIPDFQMRALAMAIFFRGMSDRQTWHLTKAMLESGQIFEYPPNSPPKVDKHSTGAIGGKTSLVLAPLLACDEVWVPMMSGRGLDITGGTLDKLESIPGFNVNLDRTRAIKQLERIGVFMMGQTAEICLADKKLYALLDVTGTVPSRPLIVASIMCKKLAENLDRLVLNVRFGKGAFMKTRDKAKWLGEAMLRVGEGMGTKISYLLTAMDEPMGRTVGNALELAEAIGRAPVLLAGGRQQVKDKIDFAVGISDLKKIGERVQRDEPLMRVHARTNDALERVLPLLRTAAVVGDERDL